MFYNSDARTYAANLRNAGAPEQVIALLISGAVNEQFALREAKLLPSTLSAQALKEEFSPERRQALVQLHIEKHNVLRAALGFVPEETARKEWPSELLSRLEPRQRDEVRQIADDYNEMVVRVITESKGHLMAEDQEKIRYLETERSKDLGRYLTANDILDFELLETGYGKRFRSGLRLFEPTQEQLRTYLVVAKKYDYHLATEDANQARRRAALKAVNAELARTWDAETYARYRRAVSSQYQAIYKLVARLNLAAGVANEIYASEKTTTERGWELFASKANGMPINEDTFGTIVFEVPQAVFDANNASRTAQTSALVDRHLKLVRDLIGDAGLAQYEAMSRSWIDSMQRGGVVQMDYSKG